MFNVGQLSKKVETSLNQTSCTLFFHHILVVKAERGSLLQVKKKTPQSHFLLAELTSQTVEKNKQFKF